MKNKLIPLLLLFPLTACQNDFVLKSKVFYFDTMIETYLYEGKKEDITELENIYSYYDKLSDNYKERDIFNVYSLNHTNEEVEISKELYDLLKLSFEVNNSGAKYFNPLCGSLAKKWKESLKNTQILDKNVINEEISKIKQSDISFLDNNKIQREGEAEIDLGGIAKGHALDQVKRYLDDKGYKNYLINGGSSSILLGEKKSKDGLYTVGLKDLPDNYIKLKNSFISTSSKSVQGVKIGDVTYSHIINPITGSAINENDAVIVISQKGFVGDALSTAMMMNTVDEIKLMESMFKVQTIVIRDNKIIYQHKDIEVLHR